MRTPIAAIAAFLLAAPLSAQEGTGTVTGTLDLDQASWVVASGGDGPASAVRESDDGTRIRIVGTPEPQGGGGAGTLTIEIAAETGAVEARVTDVRIELQREGGTIFAEDENVDLTLEAFQKSGGDVAIAGSFVATLTPEPRDGLVIDGEDAVTLDGNFQATIPVASGG